MDAVLVVGKELLRRHTHAKVRVQPSELVARLVALQDRIENDPQACDAAQDLRPQRVLHKNTPMSALSYECRM